MGVLSRSKARRGVGVGVVSLSTVRPLMVMVSRVRVARWSSRSRKPRTGWPLALLALRAALAWAAADRRAGATGSARAGRVQGCRRDGGADDVDAVQGSFGVDLGLVAVPADRPLGDLDHKVLGDLVFAQRPVGLDTDLVGVAEPPGIHLLLDLGQEGLGGGQQVGSLAGTLCGQQRVAAGHQPLAGVVR